MKQTRYRITPLGALGQEVYNTIILELILLGENAIIFNGKELVWGKVQWRKDDKKIATAKRN